MVMLVPVEEQRVALRSRVAVGSRLASLWDMLRLHATDLLTLTNTLSLFEHVFEDMHEKIRESLRVHNVSPSLETVNSTLLQHIEPLFDKVEEVCKKLDLDSGLDQAKRIRVLGARAKWQCDD